MIEVSGRFNSAKIFSDNVEEEAVEQIKAVCSLDFFADAKIRIMPDVHAGKGCTIGTTITVSDAVVPNLVGVDIGCGMEVVKIKEKEVDFEKFDASIRENIPFGRNVREGRLLTFEKLYDLKCFRDIKDSKRMNRALGTLGGGNHFIEIDKDCEGDLYIVIHSGSRNLGKQVAEIYQQIAIDLDRGKDELFNKIEEVIKTYKEQGRKTEIADEIKRLKREFQNSIPLYPDELAYLSGKYFDNYIHDMNICQEYANLNRKLMMDILLENNGLTEVERFTTVHNYIDMETMILRKGAVSAKKGEKFLIPMNMRDGSLICIGKGNEDWNCSAPHGAGRLMSRTKAKNVIDVEEYKKSMQGIFSTSVSVDTLDEAPQAYKPMGEIIANLAPTADIERVIKPVYNFKASE
ncbi:MAG: RtcB family protein [Clostridia bacterium]|nr:RtcB family protein [Clostridia bacterium]